MWRLFGFNGSLMDRIVYISVPMWGIKDNGLSVADEATKKINQLWPGCKIIDPTKEKDVYFECTCGKMHVDYRATLIKDLFHVSEGNVLWLCEGSDYSFGDNIELSYFKEIASVKSKQIFEFTVDKDLELVKDSLKVINLDDFHLIAYDTKQFSLFEKFYSINK